MPAHAGGQVVEAEQVGERARLTGPPLHRVQHPQLPVQQGLVAHGDVQEDLVDSLAQPGLVDGGGDGRRLHGAERLRDPRDLLDAAGGRLRRLGGHVHVVAPPQPLDHAWQPFVGHAADAVVQPAQVPGHLAAEPHQQEDRGHHGGQPQAADQDGLEDQPVAERRALRGQLVAVGGLHVLQGGQRPERCLGPGTGVHRDRSRAGQDLALHGLELPVGRRLLLQVQEAGPEVGRHQGEGLVHQQVPVRRAGGELLPDGRAHLAAGEKRAAHQRGLPAGHLGRVSGVGGADRDPGQRGAPVLDGRVEEAVQVVDDGAVGRERGRRAHRAGVDGRPDLPEPRDLVEQGALRRPGRGGQLALLRAQRGPGHRDPLVHRLPRGQHGRVGAGPAAEQPEVGLHPLLGQLDGQRPDSRGDGRRARVVLVVADRAADRDARRETPQRQQGDKGHGEHADQEHPDGP